MFAVINNLIEDFPRQLIILMHEKKLPIPFVGYSGGRYGVGRKTGQWSGGTLNTQDFARKLEGTDLLRIEARGPTVLLTDLGHEFAQWLLENECRADFFETPFGGWGDQIRPPGLPPEFYTQGTPGFAPPASPRSSEEHAE